MNFALTFVVGGVLGGLIYWHFSRKVPSSLEDKLRRLIHSIPNIQVISVCNRYRKILLQYRSERKEIITNIHCFLNTQHGGDFESWQNEYTHSLDIHLRLLKTYSQELAQNKENLQKIFNQTTYVELITTSTGDNFVDEIKRDIERITWVELLKGDFLATFALRNLIQNDQDSFFLDVVVQIRQLFDETTEDISLFENEIQMEKLIKKLESHTEYFKITTEVTSEILKEHLIFWKNQFLEHLNILKELRRRRLKEDAK